MDITVNWHGEEHLATAEDLKLLFQPLLAQATRLSDLVLSVQFQSWQLITEEGRNLLRASFRLGNQQPEADHRFLFSGTGQT